MGSTSSRSADFSRSTLVHATASRRPDAWARLQCQKPMAVSEAEWRQAIDDGGRFFGWSCAPSGSPEVLNRSRLIIVAIVSAPRCAAQPRPLPPFLPAEAGPLIHCDLLQGDEQRLLLRFRDFYNLLPRHSHVTESVGRVARPVLFRRLLER